MDDISAPQTRVAVEQRRQVAPSRRWADRSDHHKSSRRDASHLWTKAALHQLYEAADPSRGTQFHSTQALAVAR